MALVNRRNREHSGVADDEVGDSSLPFSGDVAETAHDRSSDRPRFFLEPKDLPWLPVSEPAFLLWVLAAIVLIWIGIAVTLRLT